MRILAVVWKTFGSFACDPFCSENKWRGTPGDKADVPATKLPLTYLFLTSLVPAPELLLSDAKNDPCRKMRDIYRERELLSGNENVKIWYVSDSFVAGTSALSPGVPRHFSTSFYLYPISKGEQKKTFFFHLRKSRQLRLLSRWWGYNVTKPWILVHLC